MSLYRHFLLAFFVSFYSLLFFIPIFASAAQLSMVSDLITDSTPSASTTLHTITFSTGSVIPPNGSFSITPEGNTGGVFTVPVGMNVSDIALSVSSGGGPFLARSLAASQSVLNDGVTIVSGVNGSITIKLASGVAGILSGDTIKVVIGNINFIVSPSIQQSYRIRLRTFDAGGSFQDIGTAMIAIVQSVAVDAAAGNVIPPIRSNGLPTGLLPGATTNVLISLNTDVPALCKFSTTTASTSFPLMSSSTIFTTANNATLHYISTPVFQNDIFTYYIRCANESFIFNTDDYIITFEVGVIPNSSTTPLPPPPPPTPSGPSSGSGGNFLKGGDVTISGSGISGASLVILKDGKIVKEDVVSALGSFTNSFTSLDRGTYTWGVYVKDPDGNFSSTYNSTIYLVGGTNNIIAPVYLSPTIKSATKKVELGASISLSGYAISLTPVQVIMNKQGDALSGKIITATTTANGNGSWKLTLPTTGLPKGTYEIKAQSLITKRDQSVFSPTLYVGIGENPNPNFKNRADLNHDGKVNLVDFSILLFNWKGSDTTADINQDGTVNLVDFSIMLANWTG